jgi:hypothetical protein
LMMSTSLKWWRACCVREPIGIQGPTFHANEWPAFCFPVYDELRMFDPLGSYQNNNNKNKGGMCSSRYLIPVLHRSLMRTLLDDVMNGSSREKGKRKRTLPVLSCIGIT